MKKAQPYKTLGQELKHLRERVKESLAEVSGAVEIDTDTLAKFERGEIAPSQDILLLLISHFQTKDVVASRLWELAGYDRPEEPTNSKDQTTADTNTANVLPADLRIIYTDMVHVMVNNYGVVINFLQGAGPGNQPLAVGRVGMSKEHARSVLQILQQTLNQADLTTKILPAPKARTNKSKPSKDA